MQESFLYNPTLWVIDTEMAARLRVVDNSFRPEGVIRRGAGNQETLKEILQKGFVPGQRLEISVTVTDSTVRQYAKLFADWNPVHFDQEYAKTTPFRGRVAQGMISADLPISIIGMELKGAILLGVDQLRFSSPVRIGDTITISVIVTEYHPEKEKLVLDARVTTQDGTVATTMSVTAGVRGVLDLLKTRMDQGEEIVYRTSISPDSLSEPLKAAYRPYALHFDVFQQYTKLAFEVNQNIYRAFANSFLTITGLKLQRRDAGPGKPSLLTQESS